MRWAGVHSIHSQRQNCGGPFLPVRAVGNIDPSRVTSGNVERYLQNAMTSSDEQPSA